MAANVVNSPLAVELGVYVVRAFVKLRELIATHKELARKLGTPQSVDAAVWSICDVMRRRNVAGALQYVPELTWIFFLRILDETEQRAALEARVLGQDYTPSISHP